MAFDVILKMPGSWQQLALSSVLMDHTGLRCASAMWPWPDSEPLLDFFVHGDSSFRLNRDGDSVTNWMFNASCVLFAQTRNAK
jgi:hypothetical protein